MDLKPRLVASALGPSICPLSHNTGHPPSQQPWDVQQPVYLSLLWRKCHFSLVSSFVSQCPGSPCEGPVFFFRCDQASWRRPAGWPLSASPDKSPSSLGLHPGTPSLMSHWVTSHAAGLECVGTWGEFQSLPVGPSLVEEGSSLGHPLSRPCAAVSPFLVLTHQFPPGRADDP